MKPQNLLLNCVLVTFKLKEHRATLLTLCGQLYVGVSWECVRLWRDQVNLREEDIWTWCPAGCESHAGALTGICPLSASSPRFLADLTPETGAP